MANGAAGIGGAASGAASGALAGSAIMPGIGTGVGAVVGGLGGLIGGLFGGGNSNDDQIMQLQQEAADAIKNVNIPKLQALQVILQKYQSAGMITPEQEQTVLQGASNMAKISTDPRLAQAQMGALQSLQQVGHTGLRPEDVAALNQVQREAQIQDQAKQEQIVQEMQQRGQGGSGAELAARLSGSQNIMNQNAANGLNLAGQASQRALQAIAQGGSMAQGMQSQSFNQQAQQAGAQDAIDRFNAANRQQVAGTNTAVNNQAQYANLANKQNIMNMNTGVANQQALQNTQAVQNDYENRLRQAQGIYAANQGLANNLNTQQQNSANKFAGTMSGIGQAAGAYAGYQQQNKLFDLLKNNKNGTDTSGDSSGGSYNGAPGGSNMSNSGL